MPMQNISNEQLLRMTLDSQIYIIFRYRFKKYLSSGEWLWQSVSLTNCYVHVILKPKNKMINQKGKSAVTRYYNQIISAVLSGSNIIEYNT